MNYTKDELDKIIFDYNQGLPMNEIANKYGRDKKAILRKLRTIGVEPRKINSKYTISNDDLDFIIQEYADGNWDAIHKRLPDVPKHKIYHLMSDANISMDSYFWSEQDKCILREYYGFIPTIDIQKMLAKQYTIRQIQNQAIKLGLTESREWSDEEMDVLLRHYEYMTGPEIQKLIPRKSVNAIYIKAASLGLKSGYVHEFYYTQDEIDFIIDNWTTMSDDQIAECLGKTTHGIADQRHKLGLKRELGYNGYYTIINYIRMNITEWKKESMKESNYKCVLTGKSFDDIHHLYGFNLILQEALIKTQLDDRESIDDYSSDELKSLLYTFCQIQDSHPLGVCLCRDVHKLFHRIYGYGNNIEEQWYEFVDRYKSGEFN